MMVVIWGCDKAKYFFREDWTAHSTNCPSGKSVLKHAGRGPALPVANINVRMRGFHRMSPFSEVR
jgi:hypothetical protein